MEESVPAPGGKEGQGAREGACAPPASSRAQSATPRQRRHTECSSRWASSGRAGTSTVLPVRVRDWTPAKHVPKNLVQHVVRQVVKRDGGVVGHGVRV